MWSATIIRNRFLVISCLSTVLFIQPIPVLATTWTDTTWHTPNEWIQAGMPIAAGYLGENFLYLARTINSLESTVQNMNATAEAQHVSAYGFCSNGHPVSVCFENTTSHLKQCTALNNATFDWSWDAAALVTLECRGGADVTNGGWSEWSSWHSCTFDESGNWYEMRTRSCTSPTPANGGQACTGESVQTQSCTPESTGTIICTELHRQGLLPDDILEADAHFGARMPGVVMDGYHFWAEPVVTLMQKSDTVTSIVNVFAQPWAKEMAYQEGARSEGSLVGKLLMIIGVPLSGAIGIAMNVFAWLDGYL